MRIGFGYDVHALADDRDLILGGVQIPHEQGLEGHSDADVLLHAVADALLGAAALGDIGRHFPDTDPTWEGADSLALLRTVRGRVAEAGYGVGNVDATVVLERPKLQPYVPAMLDNLAGALTVEPGAVSVKATMNEALGFIGAEKGAAAYAVCLLQER